MSRLPELTLDFTRGAMPAVRYHVDGDLLARAGAGSGLGRSRRAGCGGLRDDHVSGPEQLDWSVVITGVAQPHAAGPRWS